MPRGVPIAFPLKGPYGATHQGSSPTAQWGQSYVQQGNKAAYTQHYSTANGTVASAQGSQGGRGYATSSAFGNTYAGKNASGDMYAGHDGNVDQNTGSGWQKYDNGSWDKLEGIQLTEKEVQSLATRRRNHNPNPIRVKSAFIATEPLSRSIACMYQALVASDRITVGVFDSYESAAAWLQVTPEKLKL